MFTVCVQFCTISFDFYLLALSFIAPFINPSVTFTGKRLHVLMLPPSCFTVGMVFMGSYFFSLNVINFIIARVFICFLWPKYTAHNIILDLHSCVLGLGMKMIKLLIILCVTVLPDAFSLCCNSFRVTTDHFLLFLLNEGWNLASRTSPETITCSYMNFTFAYYQTSWHSIPFSFEWVLIPRVFRNVLYLHNDCYLHKIFPTNVNFFGNVAVDASYNFIMKYIIKNFLSTYV